MSTDFTASARERSKLPVTETIGHYVKWLNREIYNGKLNEQEVAVAGMSITLYSRFQKTEERRKARGLPPLG